MSEERSYRLIEEALAEDTVERDPTTGLLVGSEVSGAARITARREGVISGQEWAARVFRSVDSGLRYIESIEDGSRAAAGQTIARIRGKVVSILTAERTALNFLGHLSGIATMTSLFVKKVKGTGVTILDTRKTLPGLRSLEKKAVRDGGGENHRMNLGELILVKENHIKAGGGLRRVVEKLGEEHLNRSEIEVSSLDELETLLKRPPMRIMLDNFTPAMIETALSRLGKREGGRPEVEVSGGISLENIDRYAVKGVDYISVGSITMSAPALDISLILE